MQKYKDTLDEYLTLSQYIKYVIWCQGRLFSIDIEAVIAIYLRRIHNEEKEKGKKKKKRGLQQEKSRGKLTKKYFRLLYINYYLIIFFFSSSPLNNTRFVQNIPPSFFIHFSTIQTMIGFSNNCHRECIFYISNNSSEREWIFSKSFFSSFEKTNRIT